MFLKCLIAVFSIPTVFTNAAFTPAQSTTFHFTNTTSPTSTSGSSSRSTSSSSSASITSACCFVVQDTVSEDWWQMTTFSTGQRVINLTSITTYITPLPNGTVTNIVTNVYLTKGTFSWPMTGGVNPISNYLNGAPGPSQVTTELNGTAVVTGGVTVTSPAAFYVYNSIKIITVSAVTDANGNAACGTTSSQAAPTLANDTAVPLTFGGINSNAEAYFGGYGAAGASLVPTATFTGTFEMFDFIEFFQTSTGVATEFSTVYFNTAGSSMTLDTPPTTTVEIALTTPFIYQPERGKNGGGDGERCAQGPGKENYGYVPQAVIDYLAGDPFYRTQFPGIASCLPGGPSILSALCYVPLYTIQSAIGGDLTSSTVITVNPYDVAAVTPTPGGGGVATIQGIQQTQPHNNAAQSTPQNNPPASNPPQNNPPASNVQGQPVTILDGPNGPTSQQLPPGRVSQPPATIQNAVPSIGAIINSIIGGAPNTPTAQGVVINGPTTIPVANVPQGLVGETSTIDGTPVVIVPQATTLPPAQGSPTQGLVVAGPTTIPVNEASSGLSGQTTFINGQPFIIVPSATTLAPQGGNIIPGPSTIPLAQAPAGAQGSTTVIDGTPFLIVPSATILPIVPQGFVFPGPTTIPVANAPPGLTGSTTLISGTPFIIVPSATTLPVQQPQISGVSTTLIGGTPFEIFPSATTIPLSGAPAGLSGITSTIDGTPMLIIPSGTTLALSNPADPQTTEFGGISFLIYPSATTIPLSGAPAGLHGSTTTINGTPMLIIPATTIPLSSSSSSSTSSPTKTYPGRLTTISGSTYEVFSGPTTVPVDSEVPLKGKTTVIGGTTEVLLTKATTAAVGGKSGAVSERGSLWMIFGVLGATLALVLR